MAFRNIFIRAIALSGLFVAASTVSHAAIWAPTASGNFNWNTDTNWAPDPFPTGVNAIANLSTKNTNTQTIRLNEAITLGQLLLGDNSGSNTFTINSDATEVTNGTGSLHFDSSPLGSVGNSTLARVAGGGTGSNTINASIEVVDDLLVYSASGNITLTGALTGSGTIHNTGDPDSARHTFFISGDLSGFDGTVRITKGAGKDLFRFQAPVATSGSNDASGARFELNGDTDSSTDGRLDLARRTVDSDATFKMGELSGNGGRIQDDYGNAAGTFTLEVGHLGTDSGWNGVYAKSDVNNLGLTNDLTKVGTGTLTLGTGLTPSANLYDGVTTVKNGTLVVNGTHATGSGYLINKGATLGGKGVITTTGDIAFSNDIATLNGGDDAGIVQGTGDYSILSPGASIGTLTLNATNVVLNSASKLVMDLNGGDTSIGGTTNDLVVVTGSLMLSGTLDVNAVASFASASEGDTWRLMTYTGSLSGSGLTLGSMPTLISGLAFALDTSVVNQVNLTINAVPEASAFLAVGLVTMGMGAFGLLRRRQKPVEITLRA